MTKGVLVVEFYAVRLLGVTCSTVAPQGHADVVVELSVVEYGDPSPALCIRSSRLSGVRAQHRGWSEEMEHWQFARHRVVHHGAEVFCGVYRIVKDGPPGSVAVVVGRSEKPAHHLAVRRSRRRN